MRRRLGLGGMLVGALALAGCASDISLTDRLAGSRVSGDQDGVRVMAGSAAEAFPLAVGHCAHFNRSAQFDRKLAEGAYRFRCTAA